MFKTRILSAVIFSACAAAAQATILLSEPFNYSDGALTGANGGANVSGGAWTSLSGTTSNVLVSSSQVSGLSHGVGSREDVARAFSAADIATGTIFSSFTLTVATAPTAGADYFFAFTGLTNTNFRARTFLSFPSVAGAGFRLGLENDTASTSILTPDLAAGTYAVIVAWNATSNTGSLWVNTSLSAMVESSPNLTDTVASSATPVSRVVLRQGTGISTANSINIDDIVVATTFSELTEPIPEPSTALSLLGGVGMLVGFRRLRGSRMAR